MDLKMTRFLNGFARPVSPYYSLLSSPSTPPSHNQALPLLEVEGRAVCHPHIGNNVILPSNELTLRLHGDVENHGGWYRTL